VLHSDRAVATTENGQTDRQREQRNEQRDKRWLHRVIGTEGGSTDGSCRELKSSPSETARCSLEQ
jgi:hypothetical protein